MEFVSAKKMDIGAFNLCNFVLTFKVLKISQFHRNNLKLKYFEVSKGPFIYYVSTCRGEGGSENANFCLFLVLKTCFYMKISM